MPVRQVSSPSEPSLTIGAVSRATGFSPDTLRVWQKRYGFPVPERKPSGHRLYSTADVRRLRRISEALARGHRPGQVVPLPESRLQALLAEAGAPTAAGARSLAPVAGLLTLVRRHDAAGLTSALLSDAATLGPIEFLRLRAAPMVNEVGEAWSRGEIGVHHEHFFSERLGDVLRAVRMPYERSAPGPRLTLATLSGETHGLGLQMAALAAAVGGLEPHVLGTDTPVAEIAAAARSGRVAAVGVSISVSTAGPGSRYQLAALRRAVPAGKPILVGGQGARRSHPPGGCIILEDLPNLFDWSRRLSARSA